MKLSARQSRSTSREVELKPIPIHSNLIQTPHFPPDLTPSFWTGKSSAREAYRVECKYEGIQCGVRYDLESIAEDELNAKGHDHSEHEDGPLDEETFSMAVVALARDCYFIAKYPELPHYNRLTRMVTVLLVIFMTLGFQIFLLGEIKRFVCAKAVHDIRIAYEVFENFTYLCPEHPENCFKNLETGSQNRGAAKMRPNATVMFARLSKMPAIDQANACRIPLSQPYFFCAVLFLWTITVLQELRKTWDSTLRIATLETIPSMDLAMAYDDDDDVSATGDDERSVQRGVSRLSLVSGVSRASLASVTPPGARQATIVGLTLRLKAFFLCIQVFRGSLALYLLWVGCRWLLATTQFADLILNAMGLEFVLCLKEMFYTALMPNRNKLDLENTSVPRYPKHIPPSIVTFIQTFFFIALCLAWAVSYMLHFQQVLPHYNWDVHEACENYIDERYSV